MVLHRADLADRPSLWVSCRPERRRAPWRVDAPDTSSTIVAPGDGDTDVVERLAAWIGADEPAWTIFLDDVDHLDPATSARLATLVAASTTPHRTVVASCRTLPGWPLSAWRASGVLGLIGPTELAMSVDEVTTAVGPDHADRAASISAATAGWPLGVVAARRRLDLEPDADVAKPVSELASDVAREILDGLEAADLDLLTRIAVLDAFPLSLVGSLRADDEPRFARLSERTGLVVDRPDGLVELVAPLGEALRERLLDDAPGGTAILHAAAARAWSEQPHTCDAVVATIRHLVKAGRVHEALETARRSWDRFFGDGRLDLLAELIEAVPVRHWQDDPGLVLLVGWSHLLTGRAGRAQERVLGPALADDPVCVALTKLIRAQATWWSTDPVEALLLADQGRAELADARDDQLPDVPGHRRIDDYRLIADVAEVRALVLAGRLGHAVDRCEELATSIWNLEPMAVASLHAMRALATALLGHTAEARRWATDATAIAEELGVPDHPLLAPALLASGISAALAGEPERGAEQVEQAAAMGSSVRAANLLRLCDAAAAMCGRRSGSFVDRAAPARPARLPFVDQLLSAHLARGLLDLGDQVGAERLLRAHPPSEHTLAIWADVLIRSHPRREVARVIDHQAPASGPHGEIVRRLADATCRPPNAGAARLVTEAADLAAEHDLVGLLVAAPDTLLERPEIEAIDHRALHRARTIRADREPADQLRFTRRELDVLGAMADGHTAAQIAERLYLSLNTVKWHTANIRRKLGVDNATEALAVAGRLGLVTPPGDATGPACSERAITR